jgi:hypothetical protein
MSYVTDGDPMAMTNAEKQAAFRRRRDARIRETEDRLRNQATPGREDDLMARVRDLEEQLRNRGAGREDKPAEPEFEDYTLDGDEDPEPWETSPNLRKAVAYLRAYVATLPESTGKERWLAMKDWCHLSELYESLHKGIDYLGEKNSPLWWELAINPGMDEDRFPHIRDCYKQFAESEYLVKRVADQKRRMQSDKREAKRAAEHAARMAARARATAT